VKNLHIIMVFHFGKLQLESHSSVLFLLATAGTFHVAYAGNHGNLISRV
jgi:hypothetical protein